MKTAFAVACLMLLPGSLVASSFSDFEQSRATTVENSAVASGPRQLDRPLFESDDVLDVTIPLHFKDLCRPREDDNCDFISTTLEYATSEGESLTLPIEVKVRGGWRSLTQNCSAPLLWVRFSAAEVKGTLFDGQELLPLTTHCGRGLSLEANAARQPQSSWEQYLLKEYLAQRLYGLFSEYSLRTRLVRVHYPDPDRPNKVVHNFAFFTEHFDSMAERNGVQRLERKSFDHEKLDFRAADILALFQFMIGNTDWSIVRERNTVLVSKADGKQIPVPYDFDMSGLVDAHYAAPAPGLDIESVKTRRYLGFCHPEPQWEDLFAHFELQRTAASDLVGQVPSLSDGNLQSSRDYIDGFYGILESKDARTNRIMKACKPWPPSDSNHLDPKKRRRAR